MDFRHLRAFIAVAETRSVTKAAARLNISQPPLSRHIHQLENELGVALFVRHRQGVTLTDAGRRLLERARALDAAAAEFYDAAREVASGQASTLRIGIGWGLWDTVNRIRVEFARKHPEVTIEGKDAFCSERCQEALRDHTLDVAFARPPLDSSVLGVEPIFHERIQAVLSADHPLASRPAVSVRDLADVPLLLWDRHRSPVLYDRVLELYARAGLATPMLPTPDAGPWNHAGLMLVASGKGTYLCLGIPHTSAQPASGVAVLPVSDPGAIIEVCVVSRKGETSPLIADFLRCVASTFPQRQPAAASAATATGGGYDPSHAAATMLAK